MRIHRLEGTDAFIVFDLDDCPRSVGVTRLAAKILVDGATLLARSNTYLFATFGQQVGGASAGINAKPDDRDAAVAAFVSEVEPLVSEARFLTQPGKGLSVADMGALAARDPRPVVAPATFSDLLGTSVAVASEATLGAATGSGSLSGARVAIEGVDASGGAVVAQLAARGAHIVAVGTAKGTVRHVSGFDAGAVTAAVAERGANAIDELGAPEPAGAVFGADVDLLCVGSKPGAVSDLEAGSITAKVLVPTGPVPVTAKALAMLRRSGTVVLPDFISIAGPMFTSFEDPGTSLVDLRNAIESGVSGAMGEVLGHDQGPLLGACHRAEAFLRTWQDTLPFGRPLS